MLTTRPTSVSQRTAARPAQRARRGRGAATARVANGTPRATRAKDRARSRASAPARGGTFWLLLCLVSVLCLTGLVMILSSSSILSLHQYGSPWHFFIRQIMWLSVGAAGFVVALRVDYSRWRRIALPLMYASVGLLFAVLLPGIGVKASGASRWLGTSSLQVQPSEIAKLGLVLFAADILDRRAAKGDWKYQMAPVLAVMGILVLLVMAQPDMGTTMVMVLIALSMLFTAGIPTGPMIGTGGAIAGVGMLLAVAAPYRWRRMTSFLHPFKDASNTGYQTVQGFAALSHGHVLGDGLGSSIASYGYLPNAQTDFIFAVLGEETGLFGGFLLSGLFVLMGLVGVRIACNARTRFAALAAAGITAWIVGQAVINIGAVVGLLPVTGVPLPFVSFGGSSLVINMFALGLLANIAQQP
jgi:cell division protein FtsW